MLDHSIFRASKGHGGRRKLQNYCGRYALIVACDTVRLSVFDPNPVIR